MKNPRKPRIGRLNTIDADSFLVNDKITLKMKKKFTKIQSKLIMAAVSKCTVGKIVKWKLVAECFESDCDKGTLIKKIKNHYYNMRSAPARIKTKRSNRLISFMGLDI